MNRYSVAFLAIASVCLLSAKPARACGGFFCGNSPIDQSAEHIAFGVSTDPSGTTTVEATVQISYTGNAHDFAWVVPLHAKPTLDVGTAALFSYLDQVTRPSFTLDLGNGQCRYYGLAQDAAPTAGGAMDAGSSNGPGVVVISQQNVGPYDSAILQATDATALTNWLETNGYDLTPAGATALGEYVGPTYYFVALKLLPGKSVGDLQPIVLKMTSTEPCIPIKLTAIAATQNMPILAYLFSTGRGVPTNYRSVIVNEERIDWLNYGQNYSQIATEAVQEAGGQAFLTEFAGRTSSFSQSRLYSGQFDTSRLATITDPVSFMQALIYDRYPSAQLLSLLEHYIPEPASLVGSVGETQFYNDLRAYSDAIQNDPGRAPFDPVAFANAIETTVVAPLKRAQKLIDSSPYTTRLYTTMSPANMTVDPEFDFNTGLDDVSNRHTAKGRCLSSDPNSPVQITLSDGRTYVQNPGAALPKGPAAGVIEQLSKTGQPVILADNVRTSRTGCGGCSTADLGPGAFALVGTLLARRRRHRA